MHPQWKHSEPRSQIRACTRAFPHPCYLGIAVGCGFCMRWIQTNGRINGKNVRRSALRATALCWYLPTANFDYLWTGIRRLIALLRQTAALLKRVRHGGLLPDGVRDRREWLSERNQARNGLSDSQGYRRRLEHNRKENRISRERRAYKSSCEVRLTNHVK